MAEIALGHFPIRQKPGHIERTHTEAIPATDAAFPVNVDDPIRLSTENSILRAVFKAGRATAVPAGCGSMVDDGVRKPVFLDAVHAPKRQAVSPGVMVLAYYDTSHAAGAPQWVQG